MYTCTAYTIRQVCKSAYYGISRGQDYMSVCSGLSEIPGSVQADFLMLNVYHHQVYNSIDIRYRTI